MRASAFAGASRDIRAARALAIPLTNGSLRKKRACGATTDWPGGATALLVDGREHNEPVNRLRGPPRLDEPSGQVVEQLGVRRPLAALAKIVRGADQTLAEVVLPDPVHHHARRQRVLRASQPVG